MAVNDSKTWIGSTGPYLSDSDKAISGLQTDKTPVQDFDVIRTIDLRSLGNPVVIPAGKTYYLKSNHQLIIGNQIEILGILEISGELIVDDIPDYTISSLIPVNDEDLIMSVSGIWKEVVPMVSLDAGWLMNNFGQFIVQGVL